MGFNGPKPENSDLIARQNAFGGNYVNTDIVLYVYYYVGIYTYVFVTYGDSLKAIFYQNFRPTRIYR